jgi:hypothetical protein
MLESVKSQSGPQNGGEHLEKMKNMAQLADSTAEIRGLEKADKEKKKKECTS